MKNVAYIGVIAISAVVAIVAGGVGVYLFINASSEPDSNASPPVSERRQERPDDQLAGEKTASLRLSAGESGLLEHDSGARMEMPRGALTETVTVTISEVGPPASPTNTGRVYDFSVGDSLILVPITLHIPYELEPGADSSRIVPLHWDEELEVWMVLEGEGSSRTVAVTVLDLSRFTTAEGEVPTGSPTSTTGLAVEPRIVDVGVPEAVVVGEPSDFGASCRSTVSPGV